MLHKNIVDKVRLSLENKIYKLEQKRENYDFTGKNYLFEYTLDDLAIYKRLERALNEFEIEEKRN